MQSRIYRNAYRNVVGVWIVAIVPFAIASVSVPRMVGPLPNFIRLPLLGIAVAIGITWLVEPIWAARFRTLTVDRRQVVLRAGWLSPEVRQASRAEISSVQVERTLANRITGLWSVAVFTHGVTEASIKMPALRHGDAMELANLMNATNELSPREGGVSSVPGDSERTDSGSDEKVEGSLLYRASAADVVVTASINGVPFIVAIGVVGLLADVADLTGGVFWTSPVAIGAGAVLVAAVVAVVTALKFWDYSIVQNKDATLSISYGSVDSVRHTLVPQDRLTLTARRSLVDVLTGKVALTYSHAKMAGTDGKRVIFPSMSTANLLRTVTAIDQRGSDFGVPKFEPRWATAQLCLFVLGVATVAFAIREQGFWTAAGLFMVLILAVRLTYFASRRMIPSEHPELVYMRAAGLSNSLSLVPRSALGMVVSRRVPLLPIRFVAVTGWSHGKIRLSFPSKSNALMKLLVLPTRKMNPTNTGVDLKE